MRIEFLDFVYIKKKKKNIYFTWQAALVSLASDKGKNLDPEAAGEATTGHVVSADATGQRSEPVELVAAQLNKLVVSATSLDSTESSNPGVPGPDLDKKMRALKKKVNSQDFFISFPLSVPTVF